MTDNRTNEADLNQMILQGQIMDAFEKYYADDIIMQENNDEPRVGKDVCRTYEEQFLGNVADFHGAELHHGAVDGERSFSEWTFDMTFKDGTHVRNTQITARIWKDGQVTSERFFYQPNVVSS